MQREMGFDNVFIPPGPGDEGIAVGCAMYGLQRLRERQAFDTAQQATIVPFPKAAFPAYQGRGFSTEEVEDALLDWAPWVRATAASPPRRSLLSSTLLPLH